MKRRLADVKKRRIAIPSLLDPMIRLRNAPCDRGSQPTVFQDIPLDNPRTMQNAMEVRPTSAAGESF
jgi:hypothetical protein